MKTGILGIVCVVLVVALACGLFARETRPAGEAKAIDDSDAKMVGIKAVTFMFLRTDIDELAKLIDPDCAANAEGPGQGKHFIAGLKEEFEDMKKSPKVTSMADVFSVREILFFTRSDIPRLKKKFPKKRDLWSDKQVPAYIDGNLGCYVVAKELRDGKEIDDELYIFVIKKVRGEYKIVFYGNS